MQYDHLKYHEPHLSTLGYIFNLLKIGKTLDHTFKWKSVNNDGDGNENWV